MMQILVYIIAIPLFLWGMISAMIGMNGPTILQEIYGILGGCLMALSLIAMACAEFLGVAAKRRKVLEDLTRD